MDKVKDDETPVEDQPKSETGAETTNSKSPSKILVVGTDDSFSQQLVEYAVWFAKRMEYEIVALNCVPFGREAPKVLTPYQEELQKEFESAAAKGAELLAYRAGIEDVKFSHLVKFGSPEKCIREAHGEIEDLEFVLAEPNACREVDMEAAIPVFSYHG